MKGGLKQFNAIDHAVNVVVVVIFDSASVAIIAFQYVHYLIT